MSWKILEVDNGKLTYKLQRHTGETLSVIVPQETTKISDRKIYVTTKCDEYDSSLISAVPTILKKQKKYIRPLATLILAISCILLPEHHKHIGALAIALELLNFLRKNEF